MSGLKDTFKGGWHPKGKDGKSKESWRGDYKGVNQVASWMGKGKTNSGSSEEHMSRPLHQLKDPSAFGPPPKNVNYHGGIALPNQTTPDTSGLGAPLSRAEIERKQHEEEEEARREAEAAARPKPPPVPYRADTTGLSTSHLPPPPGRKDGADGRMIMPPPGDKPTPPGLPPRLPPRQNSNPGPSAPSPPPPYAAKAEPEAHKGILNQGALTRLGAAGVSVPGFGIGAKSKQPLPPPGASPSRSPAPTPAGNSQLSELQSRFSRLSSTAPPQSDSEASKGTTFAEKQAALKTASSFRNDPSSVSLSDAKVAASTANNFRERHGEQVKSGWQSANKLNTKYGIADKVGAYGGVTNAQAAEPASQTEMRNNTASPANGIPTGVLGKKKPPPPPPGKKAALLGAGSSGTPPPLNMSNKPKPSEPSSSQPHSIQASNSNIPKDLDLDLKSLWFAQSKAAWPPKTINKSNITYVTSSSWSSQIGRKKHTFNAHVRYYDTLASTKIKVTWDASSPGITVKSEQRHYPPPTALSKQELESCRSRYSDAVASWCESKLGKQVGDGECWTLANEALIAVGAQCKSKLQELPMSSQVYTHGQVIYEFNPSKSRTPTPVGGVQEAGVARGDVLQFYKAHFKRRDGSEIWAGEPDHTSVITTVENDGTLKVVESNTGGSKKVRVGKYNMGELVSGEIRIYRAVGESWIMELDAKW